MKEKALKFLEHETHCVLSTVSPEGSSESALVAFSENGNLEIMIGTSLKSRKFQNVLKNPRVSIVFGFIGKKSLQYEGKASVLKGRELEKRLQNHFVKHPGAIKYQTDPDNTYVIVKPLWIRMVESGPKFLGETRFNPQ